MQPNTGKGQDVKPAISLEAAAAEAGSRGAPCPGGQQPAPDRLLPPRQLAQAYGWAGGKEVRALPAAYSGAESLKPAYRIKRKAAPRAAAASGLIELGTQGRDFLA